MIINRYIYSNLIQTLKPGRVSLIMGARRVGKTTLIKTVIANQTSSHQFYNCDDPAVREQFTDISLQQLRLVLKDTGLIIFDEAQRIRNIGITLKLIADEMPDKRLLVSGSSSLDLANEITEPLTGRKKTFYLHPISFLELWHHHHKDEVTVQSYLDHAMRFGMYPQVCDLASESEKSEYLLEITQDYLYKDVLEFQEIRNPEQLRKLLTALALQIGREVSYTELANTVGVDQKTIMKYVDLLEKSYVIFRLSALSRNLRKEISKSRKIYFYDLGIRNAIIRNFNPFAFRSDTGQVWENLMVAERIKRDGYLRSLKNYYFWRTYDQKEIDLVEEHQGQFHGFEFKWTTSTYKPPADFLSAYPGSQSILINKGSFLPFVI